MLPLRCALLAALMCCPSLAALAASPDDLQWMCWLSNRPTYALQCRLEVDPLLDDDPLIGTASLAAEVEWTGQPDQAQIRNALFAAGTAPNVARLVREQPARYRALAWSIPLYGPPMDDGRVRDLAQSVLCGSSPRCFAHFGTPAMPIRTAAR